MTWSILFRHPTRIVNRFIGMAALASALMAQAPGQYAPEAQQLSREQAHAILQNLYSQLDDAFSRHDFVRVVSFTTPEYVFIDPRGKRTPYDEWRRNLANLQAVRTSHVKTTINDVLVQGNTIVATVLWEHSYDVRDSNRGVWAPKILSDVEEETWTKVGSTWKDVQTKTIRQDIFDPVPLSTMIDDDTELIAFLCGEPLRVEEKQRLASFAAAEFPRNSSTWYRNDRAIRSDLKSARENRGAIPAEIWEKWRLAIAQSAPGDVEAQIVEAHDPTVVFDRGNKLLITEHTLMILHDAVSWTAKQEGTPQPATSYVQGLRSSIRQNYLNWPLEIRSSYAHITKDFPATQQYMLGVMSEADRQKFWTTEQEEHRTNPGVQTTAIASEMSTFYDLLVKAKTREYIQVSSWGIARQRARNVCAFAPTACVPF